MFKKNTKLIIFSLLVFGLMLISNQILFASTNFVSQKMNYADLGSKVGGILRWGIIGLFVFLFIFGIWATIFWIMMIIHANKNNVKDKGVWIVLMVVTGIFGAIIYYFAVKRKFTKQIPSSTQQ